ncbi:hypothetical protein EON65_23410 [archaeon]|nr:MAG: hypothetical protein EON65_23410 [archaeon]
MSWISHIHQETTLVQHSNRPVPLRYFYAIKNGLHPLFRDPQAGPGAPNGVKRESVGKWLCFCFCFVLTCVCIVCMYSMYMCCVVRCVLVHIKETHLFTLIFYRQ